MKELPLSRGKVALVDDEDFARLSAFKWQAHPGCRTWYAMRSIAGAIPSTVRLHRDILAPPPGYVVDHINGNGLDNRRANIRLCSQRENSRNSRKQIATSSKYKGVTWEQDRRLWQAQIFADGTRKYLGRFTSEEDAARAYNAAAVAKFGVFARLNDIAAEAAE